MNPRIETLDEWARRNIKGFIRYTTFIESGEKYVTIYAEDDQKVLQALAAMLCNRYILDVIQLRAIERGVWKGNISTAKDRPDTLLINALDSAPRLFEFSWNMGEFERNGIYWAKRDPIEPRVVLPP